MSNGLRHERRLRLSDRDAARVGGTPIAKSARATAITIANDRVNAEIAAWCDRGKSVSDLREQRLKRREAKRRLSQAKAAIYAELQLTQQK